MKKQTEKESGEAAYLATLKEASTIPGSFNKLDTSKGGSQHQKMIREKINAIVEKEISLIEFKNKVATEALAADTYKEVVTKKNFFFQVDEKKTERNLKVFDYTAPGNKYRHPQVVLPHEHFKI